MLMVLKRVYIFDYFNSQSHSADAWTSLKGKCGGCFLIYHLGQRLAITWYDPIGIQTCVLSVSDQRAIHYSNG